MSNFSGLSKTERIQIWLDRLHQHAGSGQTVNEFCQQQQISIPSFYQWKRRLTPSISGNQENRSKPSPRMGSRFSTAGNGIPSPASKARRLEAPMPQHGFTELVVSNSTSRSALSFSTSQARVHLPGGITIDLGSQAEVISLIVDRLVRQSQAMASPAMASPAMASPALASPALASPALASPAMASPAMASPAMARLS